MKATKTTGRPEAEGSGVLRIKRTSWLDRQRLYPRSRDLSRALAARLALWNQELRSPDRILGALGLAEADLDLLKALGGLPQGWHPFKVDAREGAEAGRLAALGLVRLGRWRRLARLTGAGRVLLLLTVIDPKIKKTRPAVEGREGCSR